MNFTNYAVLSSLILVGIVIHTFIQQEFFYPTLVALSQEKVQLAVIYNFLVMMAMMAMRITVRLFVGRLNPIEIEQLVENGRSMVADTLLFLIFYSPTISGREIGTISLVQNIVVILGLKVFHSIAHIRTSRMFEIGVPFNPILVRVAALILLLATIDISCLYIISSYLDKTSTFYTWLLFEFINVSISALSTGVRFTLNLIDAKLTVNGWPSKAVYIFYTELVADILQMISYMMFMGIFFYQNPARLPIYAVADIVQVARQLATRLKSFKRYREITFDMDTKFPDATNEEMATAESCIICRDSLSDGCKVLQCGHIFHTSCLRSWVLVQQICPTCRSELLPRARAQSATVHAPVQNEEEPQSPKSSKAEVVEDFSDANMVSQMPRSMKSSSSHFPMSERHVVPLANESIPNLIESIEHARSMSLFYADQARFWSCEIKSMQTQILPPSEPDAMRRVIDSLRQQIATSGPNRAQVLSHPSNVAPDNPAELLVDESGLREIRKAREMKYEQEMRHRGSIDSVEQAR